MKLVNTKNQIFRVYFVTAILATVLILGIDGSRLDAHAMDFTLTAGSPGGVYFKNAAAFAEFIKKEMPGTSTTVIAGGGMANVERLDAGQADIAVLENATATLGYKGTPPARKKYNIRMLAAFSGPSRTQALIVDSAGIKSFEEIKAKKFPLRVNMFERHQLATMQAEAIFNAYGISFDDIRSWGGKVVFTSASEGFRMIEDGLSDMWFTGGSFYPHPKFIQLGTKKKFRLLPISKEVAEKVADKFGQGIMEIPADIYKEYNGVNEPYWSLATVICFGVRTDLPEDTVYKLTKILADHKEDLYAVHPQNKFYDPKTAWKDVGAAPLHPGAEKYYKEMGYMN
jgi:TRAP transporter TAXI family solute receptor